MNKKILTTLEFDSIKEELAQYLTTAQGVYLLSLLLPKTDAEDVQQLLDQTNDALIIDRYRGGLPIQKTNNLTEIFKRLKLKAVLGSSELADLSASLRSSQAIIDFLQTIKDEIWFENIHQLIFLINRLTNFSSLSARIDLTVDEQGKVLDTASKKLARIRKNILLTQHNVRTILSNMVKGNDAKYLSEPIISTRDNVLVLPVKSEFRKHFGGVIHDQSQSGLTLYVEPTAVSDLNNHLHDLNLEEVREINAILIDISQQLFPFYEQLRLNDELIGQLDLIQAKAKLANASNAIKPTINHQKIVDLKQARHPLLPKDSVANDIALGDGYLSLIITGPNTGGKTVLMKTLGLLQLMAQAGLFISAEQGSSIYIFNNIFADIGDEQSLEQSLSTFSSHIKNIKTILETADDRSLVLLDELGAGTDPSEGAALAMAIVEALSEHGILNLTTTHYPELKVFADQKGFAINASMEFDLQTLQPTYRLLLGIPGQSNAIAISRRLGIQAAVLQQAESYVDPKNQELNNLIQGLVAQRQDLADKQDLLQHKLSTVDDQKNQLDQQLADLDQEKAKTIMAAKNEANHIVSSVRQESKQLLDQIRQQRLLAGSTAGKNEQELKKIADQIDELRQDSSLEKNKVLKKARSDKQFKIGDDVMVTAYHQVGTIIDKISNQDWQVQLGILKMNVNGRDLEKVSADQQKKLDAPVRKNSSTSVVKTASRNVSGHLDLRGERYEQAMMDLDRYIDQAMLNNIDTIEIIHGKGTGALRQGVSQMLRSDRRIKHYEFANPNGAGDGATIVELN
ncbi:endonuclease MutS2 [Oenococcus sicerae]|uniref:Endonuclease MutS2 n=1 Tax=Oenococcus sicerae TaxID=2203724 RepID=A0ABX5QMB0_9LACO|nr:endonuclease MutS2 [Oenococcus sicerae]QAS69931.1 endonuclease MutS2 [Oenococcus sicerae]